MPYISFCSSTPIQNNSFLNHIQHPSLRSSSFLPPTQGETGEGGDTRTSYVSRTHSQPCSLNLSLSPEQISLSLYLSVSSALCYVTWRAVILALFQEIWFQTVTPLCGPVGRSYLQRGNPVRPPSCLIHT